MNPGLLNRKIEIQKDISNGVPNENGYLAEDWVTIQTPWASVSAVGGMGLEKISGGGLIAKASIKFRIRYRYGITTRHRVVYAGQPMNIVFVDDEKGRHKYLTLYCEVQSDGS